MFAICFITIPFFRLISFYIQEKAGLEPESGTGIDNHPLHRHSLSFQRSRANRGRLRQRRRSDTRFIHDLGLNSTISSHELPGPQEAERQSPTRCSQGETCKVCCSFVLRHLNHDCWMIERKGAMSQVPRTMTARRRMMRTTRSVNHAYFILLVHITVEYSAKRRGGKAKEEVFKWLGS